MVFYSNHQLAALRDAYLYCDNKTAFAMLKKQGDNIAAFAIKANPDLYTLTGDEKLWPFR